MRVQLDPGNPELWADLAEPTELLSGDVKAARKAVRVVFDQNGNRSYSTGEDDEIADIMLTRCVRAWTVPLPIPAEDPASLDKLPPEAYEILKDAVEPHVELINRRPSSKTSSGSATG